MRLKDKVTIVSGAATGLGRAVALRFAREGARVVAIDIDAQKGQALIDQARTDGGQAPSMNTSG